MREIITKDGVWQDNLEKVEQTPKEKVILHCNVCYMRDFMVDVSEINTIKNCPSCNSTDICFHVEYRDYEKLQKQHEEKIKEIQYELKKRWLSFLDVSKLENKTKTFQVINNSLNQNLGDIRWDNGWRQYVFDDGDLKLAEGCLYELFEKIRELRLSRKKDFDKIVRD